jgi:hypothetical protein
MSALSNPDCVRPFGFEKSQVFYMKGLTLTDIYVRLAAALWFLPLLQLERVLSLAEELSVEQLRDSLERGTVF